jgi:hypothetical protein
MWKPQRATLMAVGSALIAVAPKCPICFLAYFGVFGVATTSASVYRAWLPPLTAIWLALTIGMLFFQRGGQRRYGPGLLGIFAGLAVFVGRFVFNYQNLVYGGVAALIGAVVWRTWFRTSAAREFCTQCDEIPLVHHNQPGVNGP